MQSLQSTKEFLIVDKCNSKQFETLQCYSPYLHLHLLPMATFKPPCAKKSVSSQYNFCNLLNQFSRVNMHIGKRTIDKKI